MQYRIYILELTPCSAMVLKVKSQAMRQWRADLVLLPRQRSTGKMRLPVNQWVTVELLGQLASVQVDIIEQAPRLPIQLNFETSGQIVDISQTPEDTIYLLQSNLALPL